MFLRLFALLLKLFIFLVIVIVIYVVAVAFILVPVEYTPQKLAPASYNEFKGDLSREITKHGAMSSVSKQIWDFLAKIERGYAEKEKADKIAAEAATNQPTTQEAPAITKARETIDNYQQKIDDEKKLLDSL